MSGIVPVAANDVHALVSGGTSALQAVEESIAGARGPIAADIFQIGLDSSIGAFEHAVGEGASVHVLVDPRMPLGGMGDRVGGLVRERGQLAVYGDGNPESWMHSKTFHVTDVHGRPSSWITNLSLIEDTHVRSELSLLIGGEAAIAAREVTLATIGGDPARIRAAIDAAKGAGVLVNDPAVGRRVLTQGIHEMLARPGADLLAITKGIDDARATNAIVDARRGGRDVQVFVRDLARADGELLVAGGVDARVVSGGPKPRINAFFAGDRAVIGSAFLWRNMTGSAAEATSRDVGIMLEGAPAQQLRDAAMATIRAQQRHVQASQLVGEGSLLDHI